MTTVGIDFGNENCYVAVARAGGIETITNEYSQRATPSYIAFGSTCRDIGTSGKNKLVTNLTNTVCGFKRLIGKKYKDAVLQHELSYLPYCVYEMPNGSPGVKVSYLGKDVIFTLHQITAMMFTKLKSIAETAVGTNVSDCVVSVPVFFTDAERRAMLDACHIAGLNVIRLLNETTAVALAYGFYRQDMFEDKQKKVVFVDIGHSAVQATACAFTKGKLKILSSAWDICLGGRDIDTLMVRHFSTEFQEKYKLNVLANNRAILRLLQECEKLKKQLSANPQVLPMNIECFTEDVDVSSSLGREKLEELCSNLFVRIETVFRKLLLEANLHPNDISCVELVGGSTRIPAIKSVIKKVFNIEPSTTLNQDEAVARGCAIQAAMLSPALKVREFSITDIQPYTINLTWNISNNEHGNIEVFPANHQVPFSKLLTFFKKDDFSLEAFYNVGDDKCSDTLIGSFIVKDVNKMPSGESAKIVVKVRVNIHGIFTICSATIVEKDFKANNQLDQKVEDMLDLNAKGLNVPVNSVLIEEKKSFLFLKKQKKFQEIQLEVEPKVPELSESEMKALSEREQKMIQQDMLEKQRIDAKNSVEEYVYEMRNRLSEDLKDFVDTQEMDNLVHKLSTVENWIYEEGENENENVYLEKLSELKLMAEPVLTRQYEHEHRPMAIKEFQQLIDSAQIMLKSYLSGDKKYSYVEPKEMEKVQRTVDEKQKWLNQQVEAAAKLKFCETPTVLTDQIRSEKEKLLQGINPVIHKKKS